VRTACVCLRAIASEAPAVCFVRAAWTISSDSSLLQFSGAGRGTVSAGQAHRRCDRRASV